MSGYRNFTELVQARAAQAPDREALVVLPDTEDRGRAETVSYRALDAGARRLAGWLQDRGAAGERVLVLHTDRRLFAVSFLACLYAGAVAVPAPPPAGGPGGRSHHETRIAGIVKDAAPCVVLTDAAAAPEVSQLLARSGHGGVPCLAADVVPGSAPWRPPELGPESVAFLQYTSGSTAEPRGVVITHGNLLANQRAICRALGTVPATRIGGWLPFHHDMGLAGQLLHPLWLGGTSVVLSPEAFVRRPVRWLEAIARYGVTVSAAPDFAYDLCVRRITDEQAADLDLSGWETAVSGGEPVREETRRAFTEKFAPAGLRPGAFTPCYGLAEATLLVTGAAAGRGSGAAAALTVDAAALERNEIAEPVPGRPARTLLSCGPAAAGTEVRVTDPGSGRVLPEGEIGEIRVRGAGVARGYWRRPAESARTFGARTPDEPRAGEPPAAGPPAAGPQGPQGPEDTAGHLRTGDLGTLHRGELYVTGRLRDMIVVAGRNLYPQDLERTVQRVSALFGAGTVFAVPGERERVVVVQELRARSRYDVDLPGLAAAVERCLAEEFEISAGGVLLVRSGTVRRTTSGKVERAAMRGLFLRGELKPLHQRLDPEVTPLLPAGGR
ncbi:fatty acyl-AMP ligase [Streptomyces xinghaiensis]|uniref:fatty acyl-AMP ligase n=1 Tax=Streptomyces xinghaiensis TaxID=1038928 RepID=UPI00344A1072